MVFEAVAVPVIAGTTASHPATDAAPIAPFPTATVTDPNAGAVDTLTLTLAGGGGVLGEGAGFAGTPTLVATGPGRYGLTGPAAAITQELKALSFAPNAGAPGSSATTTFTLADTMPVDPPLLAADATATVTDGVAAAPVSRPSLPVGPTASRCTRTWVTAGTAPSRAARRARPAWKASNPPLRSAAIPPGRSTSAPPLSRGTAASPLRTRSVRGCRASSPPPRPTALACGRTRDPGPPSRAARTRTWTATT